MRGHAETGARTRRGLRAVAGEDRHLKSRRAEPRDRVAGRRAERLANRSERDDLALLRVRDQRRAAAVEPRPRSGRGRAPSKSLAVHPRGAARAAGHARDLSLDSGAGMLADAGRRRAASPHRRRERVPRVRDEGLEPLARGALARHAAEARRARVGERAGLVEEDVRRGCGDFQRRGIAHQHAALRERRADRAVRERRREAEGAGACDDEHRERGADRLVDPAAGDREPRTERRGGDRHDREPCGERVGHPQRARRRERRVEERRDPPESPLVRRAHHAGRETARSVHRAGGDLVARRDRARRLLAGHVRRDDLALAGDDDHVGRRRLAGSDPHLVAGAEALRRRVLLAAGRDAVRLLGQAGGHRLRRVASVHARVRLEPPAEREEQEEHRGGLEVDLAGARDRVPRRERPGGGHRDHHQPVGPHASRAEVLPRAAHDRRGEEQQHGEREEDERDAPHPADAAGRLVGARGEERVAVEDERELHHAHAEERGDEEARVEEPDRAAASRGGVGEAAARAAEVGRGPAARPHGKSAVGARSSRARRGRRRGSRHVSRRVRVPPPGSGTRRRTTR
ncbi:MAG: hypothetical protein HMLKMBBP_01482 [Planctomycetes bacterium]|nr:hypothetical protein [Planctomycetota bacterium]